MTMMVSAAGERSIWAAKLSNQLPFMQVLLLKADLWLLLQHRHPSLVRAQQAPSCDRWVAVEGIRDAS